MRSFHGSFGTLSALGDHTQTAFVFPAIWKRLQTCCQAATYFSGSLPVRAPLQEYQLPFISCPKRRKNGLPQAFDLRAKSSMMASCEPFRIAASGSTPFLSFGSQVTMTLIPIGSTTLSCRWTSAHAPEYQPR